jgi:hypothetical protein
MPFTFAHRLPAVVLGTVSLVVLLSLSTLVQAETKTIVSEATYSMGDGETPSFAEAMVLQKAKQRALEEAGTYVESYTKVRNLDLTAEEIQTIAGGVVQVEVLEKKRSAVGEGFQFFIKIKATVTTDKMEELAQRVRGRNVAEEYKQLQDNYARLSKEFEALKLSIAKSTPGPGRDAALAQIRERESEFRSLQQSEATFFERLISGETLFSNALAQLSQKENERQVVENLFNRIVVEGHSISLGEPTIHAGLDDKNVVGLSVPVTIKVIESIKTAMVQTARSLGGLVLESSSRSGKRSAGGLVLRMGTDLDTVAYFQKRIANLVFVMEARLTNGSSIGCYLAPVYEMYGFDGYVGALGVAPVKIATNISNRMEFFMLGPSFFDPSTSVRKLKDSDGFILILDTPVSFTLETTLRLDAARQIRSLMGKIVEGKRSSDYFPPTAEGLRECSVAVSAAPPKGEMLLQPPPPAPKFRDLSPAAK